MRHEVCLLLPQDLAAALPPDVALWAVDTACLYPMRLTARAPAKAYIFRSSTDKPRRERLQRMPYTNGATDWARLLGGAAAVVEVAFLKTPLRHSVQGD
jgi:hypothetical protein